MKEETIVYGLLCDCGCDAPLTRHIEDEPTSYALFKFENEAKDVAKDVGCGVGMFKITRVK